MTSIYKSAEKMHAAYKRQNGVCALCGKSMKLSDANLDHATPKSNGGLGASWNLQAAHVECNSAKGNGAATQAIGARAKKRMKERAQKQQSRGSFPALCGQRCADLAG